jgi:hypothetical protein
VVKRGKFKSTLRLLERQNPITIRAADPISDLLQAIDIVGSTTIIDSPPL